jgi:hypothetical protein
MTLPTLLLGFAVSSLYGAAFHLWRNGGPLRLVLYLVLSWSGFWLGQLIANWLGWTFFHIGPLNLGMATLGSLVFLFIGYWLSLVEVDRSTS